MGNCVEVIGTLSKETSRHIFVCSGFYSKRKVTVSKDYLGPTIVGVRSLYLAWPGYSIAGTRSRTSLQLSRPLLSCLQGHNKALNFG